MCGARACRAMRPVHVQLAQHRCARTRMHTHTLLRSSLPMLVPRHSGVKYKKGVPLDYLDARRSSSVSGGQAG